MLLLLLAIIQQPVRAVEGLVRATGDSGAVITGADVRIGGRSAMTDAAGRFRLDSIPFGERLIVIRALGYAAHRSMITVDGDQARWEFRLRPGPFNLPEVIVEARRLGIYGTVTDLVLRPLAGAKVEVIGNRGGTVVTDSTGRFAFPEAVFGGYLIRATHPRYAERRVMVDVERGKGKNVGLPLGPGPGRQSTRAEAGALLDLRRELAMSPRRMRMVGEELVRYGTLSVCDVPRVRLVVGRNQLGVLNGERVMMPGELCSWNMDEIGMIQFFNGHVVIWEKW